MIEIMDQAEAYATAKVGAKRDDILSGLHNTLWELHRDIYIDVFKYKMENDERDRRTVEAY